MANGKYSLVSGFINCQVCKNGYLKRDERTCENSSFKISDTTRVCFLTVLFLSELLETTATKLCFLLIMGFG